MKFKQSPETKRFLEIVDELRSQKIVGSDADFCRKIGYSPQSFNQFRQQKRNVTVELMANTLTMFQANPVYILKGEGDLFIPEDENSMGVTPRSRQRFDVIVTELLQQTEAFRNVIKKYSEHSRTSGEYIAKLEKELKELKKNAHVGREKRT